MITGKVKRGQKVVCALDDYQVADEAVDAADLPKKGAVLTVATVSRSDGTYYLQFEETAHLGNVGFRCDMFDEA